MPKVLPLINERVDCMKKQQDNKNKSKWLIIVPILLTVLVLPLILHMKIVKLSPDLQPLWNGSSMVSDIFSYYKMVFLLACSIALLIGMLLNIKYIKEEKRNQYILILVLYSILTILSTVLSSNMDIALFGFVDRFEGMFAILSYVLLSIACIVFITSKWEIIMIYKALAISAAIIGLISIFQHLGFDIFRTELIKGLIIPSGLGDLSDVIFNFNSHAVYGTLQNPNYVGSYMAMLLPIAIMLYMTSSNKTQLVSYGLLSGIVFLSLLGSLSRTGIAGALISIGLLAILYRKKAKVQKKRAIALLLCLILAFALTNYVEEFKLREGASQYLANKRYDKIIKAEPIDNIELSRDTIKIKTGKVELNIAFKGNNLSFSDQNNNELKIKKAGETITFQDEIYHQYILTIPSRGGIIRVKVDNREISFAYTEKTGFMVSKGNGTLAEIDYPKHFGFTGNERFASARGYIWSRTIPILKETLLVGKGPDTFITSFPQNDFVGKMNVYGTIDVVVDKPHNMYLQTAVNTGIVSLILLLSLFLLYIVNSLRIYSKASFDDALEIYGLCSFLAVNAYLVAGLFNDSVISVAPVFWVLLGIGIAINRKLQKKLVIK
jgi:O-antigen ligase